MKKHERLSMHGRWLEIEAWCGETGPENRVDIRGSYGEYVMLTGHTVHDVVLAVMKAAPKGMKSKMIEHLEMLIKEEENHQ